MFQVGIKWYKKRKFGMCNPKQNIFERIFRFAQQHVQIRLNGEFTPATVICNRGKSFYLDIMT